MAKKPTRTARNPYQTAESGDELSPANQIAHAIVAERPDLLPSVEHIMNAGLDEPATAGALGRFQVALTNPGDPNRDPRVAVTAR